MRRLALLLVLYWPALAWGQLELPREVAGEPSSFVVVKAKTDGLAVRWVVIDPGLSLIPPELLKDSKSAVVMAGRAGRYRLLAYTSVKDTPSDPAICVVVIGGAPPPGPDPVPPGPTPPPDDPLLKTLQAAYDTERDENRAVLKGKLAALYRQGAEVTGNVSLVTWGDLFGTMSAAAGTLGVSGKLPEVQKAVAQGPLSSLPTERQRPLDTDGRGKARTAFLRAAGLLEGVK